MGEGVGQGRCSHPSPCGTCPFVTFPIFAEYHALLQIFFQFLPVSTTLRINSHPAWASFPVSHRLPPPPPQPPFISRILPHAFCHIHLIITHLFTGVHCITALGCIGRALVGAIVSDKCLKRCNQAVYNNYFCRNQFKFSIESYAIFVSPQVKVVLFKLRPVCCVWQGSIFAVNRTDE